MTVEKAKTESTSEDDSGGIGMIHLAGAVGLRITIVPAQRELAESLLRGTTLEVPYVFKETR